MEWEPGSSKVCLKRGVHSDKGADLKYGCEMVCGVHGKVMHGSNTKRGNRGTQKQEVREKINGEFNSERHSGEHKVPN